MPALPIVALFGPTGVGKTAVAIALAERLAGDAPVAVSADALQLYAGLGILTGAASAAERARLEHRLIGVVDVSETFSAGRYAALAHAEIDALVAAGRRPIVVGGTGLYLRAALADLDLRPPPDPALREHWLGELERHGPAALHAELVRRQPGTTVSATDGHRLVRALELLDAGHAPPERSGESQLWTTHTRHPTHLVALTMERSALYEQIEARVDAMVAAGAADEVRAADRAGASATARKALGFEHLLAGDIDGMKQATRRYARRQLTWLRKLPGVQAVDVTGRSATEVAAEITGGAAMIGGVRFEKWTALGNDYLIVERDRLPVELTPERVQRLCDPHFGPGGDGVLELSPPANPGFVAALRIFNPDGSEAELSGNGAREAIMYLRRHEWTTAETFSIETKAGEIRPTITGPTTCQVDMGRATAPVAGEVAGFRYLALQIGNPQCAIHLGSVAEVDALDLPAIGPAIEHGEAFPNRTNVSFWSALAPDRIRARIFERGVGETLSSGTGASGAAVAHVSRGGDSPVTVVLDGGELVVDVGEDLHVDLTGWAEPIYAGECSPEFVDTLRAL